MATTIGTVELLATIDTSKYKKGAKDIEQANSDIEESTEKTTSRAGKMFSNLGKAVAAGTAVAGAAIAAMAVQSVKSFASLEQSLGGSEVVFGELGQKIQDVARDSAKVMGTSMNQYLETANKMGSLFQGAGFDTQKSFELTTGAMQRATDVATAMGISTEMALESIAGAAKGNFTMMDNLGVAMNDTALEAYRLDKGLGKAVSKMTTAEKVGLAMELFMERTAKYAGNYAKENMTLAGSFQTLRGSWSNFLSGVDGSDTMLIDAIKNMGIVLKNQIPQISKQMGLLGAGIIKEVIAQTGIQPFLTKVGEYSTKVMNILKQGFEVVRPSIQALSNTFKDDLYPAIFQVWNTVKRLWEAINPGFSIAIGVIAVSAINVFVAALNTVLSITGYVISAFTNVVNWISNIITWMGEMATKAPGLWNMFAGAAISAFNAVRGAFSSVWNWITGVFSTIGQVASSAIKAPVNAIIGFAQRTINGFIDAINGAIGAINNIPGVSIGNISRMNIPMLAQGGVVSAPTLAMIGEGNESEAVIPLSKLDSMLENASNGGSGNAPSIIINMDGVMARSRADLRDIAKDLIGAIDEERTARGLSPINGGIA